MIRHSISLLLFCIVLVSGCRTTPQTHKPRRARGADRGAAHTELVAGGFPPDRTKAKQIAEHSNRDGSRG